MSILNWIHERLSGGKAHPPNAHETIATAMPEVDHGCEGDGIALEEGDLIGQSFAIKYCDSKGQKSSRRITVRSLKRTDSGNLCLCAFCWERKALRSFRADNILELIDLSTGEVLGDPVKFFEQYLAVKPLDSSQAVLKDCRPGLRALLYLARADGFVHPAETQVMRNYVAAVANGRPYSWDAFGVYLEKQHPEKGLAKTSLKVFWHREPERKLLLDAARILTEADGVVVAVETEGLHKIESLLNDPEDAQSLEEFLLRDHGGVSIKLTTDGIVHSGAANPS